MKIQESVVSGTALGISAFIARTVMKDMTAGISMLPAFLLNPLSWFFMVLGVYGFIHLQVALFKERISYVIPLVTAISIVTPVVLSVVLMDELVSRVKWLGIGMILTGVVGISKRKGEKSIFTAAALSLKKQFR